MTTIVKFMQGDIKHNMKIGDKYAEKKCGCYTEITNVSGNGWVGIVKHCDVHEKEYAEEQRKKNMLQVEFMKFPNVKSEHVYEALEEMIERLSDAGVDVSYFPERARQVLKDTAIEISKL